MLSIATLSGFGTPISSMPGFFQKVTYLNPLRHVVFVLRCIYLKGVGLEVLWPDITFMFIFAVVLLHLSDHFKIGQRWSGQNRPTTNART